MTNLSLLFPDPVALLQQFSKTRLQMDSFILTRLTHFLDSVSAWHTNMRFHSTEKNDQISVPPWQNPSHSLAVPPIKRGTVTLNYAHTFKFILYSYRFSFFSHFAFIHHSIFILQCLLIITLNKCSKVNVKFSCNLESLFLFQWLFLRKEYIEFWVTVVYNAVIKETS